MDEQGVAGLSARMISLVADARAQWAELDRRIAAFDAEFAVRGFGRRPSCGTVVRVVGPAFNEETAGRKGAGWSGAAYGDLRIADGAALERQGGERVD
jgi:hypothetical protein